MRDQNANTGLISLQTYRNNHAENDKDNIIRCIQIRGEHNICTSKDNEIDEEEMCRTKKAGSVNMQL